MRRFWQWITKATEMTKHFAARFGKVYLETDVPLEIRSKRMRLANLRDAIYKFT